MNDAPDTPDAINTFALKFKDNTLAYDYLYNRDNLPDTFEIIIDPAYSKQEVTVTKEQLDAVVSSAKSAVDTAMAAMLG